MEVGQSGLVQCKMYKMYVMLMYVSVPKLKPNLAIFSISITYVLSFVILNHFHCGFPLMSLACMAGVFSCSD